MADLVRIPWQPVYWLTPHTLKYLVAASKRLGYNGVTTGLMLYTGDPRGLLSAWRSYAQQKLLYLAFLNGGSVASNPDTGPRMHMRGGAADLVRIDLTAQAACRAVGLIRDPDESWHWNDPLGTSMPIIKTNTATAGGGSSPLDPEMNGDPDMRVLFNTDTTVPDDKKRWLIGELTMQQITGPESQRERKFWGDPVNVTPGELAATTVLVNQRRAVLGLPVVAGPSGSAGPSAAEIADAVADEQAQRLAD